MQPASTKPPAQPDAAAPAWTHCPDCPAPATCALNGCWTQGGRSSATPAMVPQGCQQAQADAGGAAAASFSPGAWFIEGDDEVADGVPAIPISAALANGGSRTVADVASTLDDSGQFALTAEDRANAHLIVASPEIYAALHDARDNGLIYWEPNTERGHVAKAEMLARIDAALSKAEGRQS